MTRDKPCHARLLPMEHAELGRAQYKATHTVQLWRGKTSRVGNAQDRTAQHEQKCSTKV